jgi:hypothetical protein
MLLNPRYGSVGVLTMPYYFIFEFLGPAIQVVGRPLRRRPAARRLESGVCCGLLPRRRRLGSPALDRGPPLRRVATEALPTLVGSPEAYDLGNPENFGYRQLNTVWRALAIVSFLRKYTDWDAMERRGFDTPGEGA